VPSRRSESSTSRTIQRRALLVGVVAHRAVELGGEDDVVAPPAGQCLGDDLLGLALGVDVGGVDDVDPGVQRAVDDPDALVVVGVAPGAEHHRAEAQLADRDAGASERAMLHQLLLVSTPALGLACCREVELAGLDLGLPRKHGPASSGRSCRSRYWQGPSPRRQRT
jgi:hypothetical protein